MLTATAVYDSLLRRVTVTDTTPVVAPSTGTVVYSVIRQTQGYADETLAGLRTGPALVLGPVRDGVYGLVLRAYDAGTVLSPISPPTFIDESAPLTVVATGTLQATIAADYDQHAKDYLRAGRDGDEPLLPVITGFVRLTEATALVLESAAPTADRLLRDPLPPIR